MSLGTNQTSNKQASGMPEGEERNNRTEEIFEEIIVRASPVVQWLRIRLPVQGTWVRALVREDPTCCRATKPMYHSY